MAVFLREDGQLALGTKTPVSILQETLHKKGISPHYELLYNGVGTPEPRFKYRVSAEGLTAIGDGKSKKEAKHDAAATLLKKMMTQTDKALTATEDPVANCREEVDIASPYSGSLKTNYVGKLDEICVINKIHLPFYIPIREEGPPHARVFTMQCKVGSVSETAVARTKKQAKHLVAQQMVDRISVILGSKFLPELEKEDEDENENVEISFDLKAIKNGTFRHDLTVRVCDLHNVFHQRNDESPLPIIFTELPEKPVEFYENLESPIEFLENVVVALDGVVTTSSLTIQDLEQGMALFDEASEEFEDEEDSQENTINENDVDKLFIEQLSLPEFPVDLSDDETEISEQKLLQDFESLGTGTLGVKGKSNNTITEQVNSELRAQTDMFYVFLKVEVPKGVWSFIAKGNSNQEALNTASVSALKFLRIMASAAPAQST